MLAIKLHIIIYNLCSFLFGFQNCKYDLYKKMYIGMKNCYYKN